MDTTTVVIGAGQGGLATSRCLSDRSIDHWPVFDEVHQLELFWETVRPAIAA